MKLTKKQKQQLNRHSTVDFFRKSAIPDLRESLLELMDTLYGVEEKLEEFSELIKKKDIELAEKEAEELTNG